MSSPLAGAGLGAAERQGSPASTPGWISAGGCRAGIPWEKLKKKKKKKNKWGLKKINRGSTSCDKLFRCYTFPVSKS